LKALLALAFALPFLSAAPVAQEGGDDPPPAPRCNKCKHTGRLKCRDCRHSEPELEDGVIYCSWKGDCESCLGAGWLDCHECENEAAAAWVEERRERQRTLGEKHAKEIDEVMERPLLKCESDHFVLVWDLEKQKVGKKLLDSHEAMHLYAERLEALFADYCEVFQAGEAAFPNKARIFVWWLPKDQRDASARFLDSQSDTGVKLLGSKPSYSLCARQQNVRDDEDLHRNIVHNVAHLLLSAQTPQMWIGNRKGGWADAGVAHLFEYRLDGLCTNYCYQEQNTNQDFKGGDWKKHIRKMVDKDDAPPVAMVFEQNTDTLSLEMHAVAFSYVEYLAQLDGAKANRLFRMMRGRTATRDAFQAVYGQKPLEFEEAWKAWVLETYPRR
jgi:hypothetical protein